ncbi:VOC family protein [Mucilaginibacter sp. CSA2-8R]|uniref:VOC family protein n=1 Tax=Mucilaginibacter sp. CSA2-8R TaxID=3141542 RepID=UPI00315D1236
MKLRIARHTQHLQNIINFYVDVMGLQILGKFNDHNGYNGIFLGLSEHDWHLEFTTSAEAPQHQTDEDDLLVWYAASQQEYEEINQRFVQHAITPITAKNPYWNDNGTTYTDPDGFRIVIAKPPTYASF